MRLWELDPAPILEGAGPGLCPFLPLFRGDPRELLVKSREKIVKAPESAVSASVKHGLLLLLGGLAGRVIADKSFIRRVISEIRDMGDNVFFDLIQEEAMEKGMEKGRLEGRAEGARLAVLRVLARRFGDIPQDIRARVERVGVVEQLEHLHDEAITCRSLDAFEKILDLD